MLTYPGVLAEWLSYLERLRPEHIELGLERIQPVAQALGLTPFIGAARDTPTIVTVAGTNGKGSTVASLAAIYLAAGYRVATYTSPHLWEFVERIQLNGAPVDETTLCAAFAVVEKARGTTPLTYFEFTTLAALWIFQQHALDIVVLEVGMGGRLDAVNIVDADVAIITTIDLDHQAWLGDTREQIGREKAGICRAGRPVVCGYDMPASVYQVAQGLNCPTYSLGREFTLDTADAAKAFTFNFPHANPPYSQKYLTPNLLMPNIALSLMTQRLLAERYPVTPAQISVGLAQCYLPGRQEQLPGPVWQLFDVAHNPQSVRSLARRLSQNVQRQETYAVFSMLRDKALAASIAAIIPCIDEWYVAGLNVARGMQTDEIAAAVRQIVKQPVMAHASIQAAYRAAYSAAQKNNARLVVFGSFHTVAEACSKHGK